MDARHVIFLLAFIGGSDAQAPAFCPVSKITTCHNKLEKCTPKIWHGIDSLEKFELTPLNLSHIAIRSLSNPPSFTDTVGAVIVRGKGGGPADPRFCVHAPPAPTDEGNCTTHVEAFFSDANATLKTAIMESCGILTWIPAPGYSGHPYGQWVHANEPTPSPAGSICDWQPGLNLYQEVGTNPPDTRYFTLENDRKNASQVTIHSVNGSFPDTSATVFEVGDGTPGKIAFRAQLFDGITFRGIMRANSAGGVGCCEIKKDRAGIATLKDCPVLSWWSPEGVSQCWFPVNVPSEPLGACGER